VPRETFVFGSYRLMPAERTLLDEGKPLRLGSRALDLLVTLVEHAGETVRKDTLIASAWPDTIVDEASLRVHIAALRKTLGHGLAGDRFIANVPGRGYVFVAPAKREQIAPLPVPPNEAIRGNDIPSSLTRIVGRDEAIATLARQLSQHRLLTIVGPGGIGKTTVAAAVAERVRPSYPDGVWFVGLASLRGPELLPSAVGAALGMQAPSDNATAGLTAWLRDRQALIVLDNCEHVVEAAANLAEEIVKSAPGVAILATSREPLRAVGEWRHRLAPLQVPLASDGLAVGEALKFSAVQLFNERALASSDEFVLDERDTQAVVEICRRLDGVPLALELAAAHVGVLGIEGLAARLDDRFALLIQGRRSALARHQTLRATLDWSHDLLPAAEQIILRRLAVFHGYFTMDAAGTVAGYDGLTTVDVVNGLANLVDKSLVAADISGEVTYYHLLEMTRAYALEKLGASGEGAAMSRRHAAYFRDVFAHAEAGASRRTKDEWLEEYGPHIHNLRAALDWAFSPEGDAALGVVLAALAMDFWIALSLLRECCDWGLKAVAALGAEQATRTEMMLQSGLGKALTYSRGMQHDAQVAITRALTLAESLGEAEYQFRNTYALWLFALRVVDFRRCLSLSEACEALAGTTNDAWAAATTDFAFGQTRYYLGEHAAAAANLEHARATYPRALRGGDPIRMGGDLLTCSACYQAVTFWSLGLADKAYRAGREAVAEARSVNHAVSLCTALAAPSSILLVKMGYLEEAARCIDELIDQSEQHSLTPFYAFGLCSKGGLVAARGDVGEAERLLCLGLQRSRDVGYVLFDAFFQGELAAVLATAGRIEDGLAEIDAALAYAERSESLWCMPELLRIKGELLVKHAAGAAETWFTRSCELAARQQALSWELRASMSLVRLWHFQNRTAAARELIDNVYNRFTEGHGTADLQAAAGLLKELSP
jgi:predicted ATPase